MRAPIDPLDVLLDQSRHAAQRLRTGRPVRIAFVACSYDTAFEPVSEQIEAKIRQLEEAYGRDEAVEWSLWIVDDLPPATGFSESVKVGFHWADSHWKIAERLHCLPMKSAPPRAGGLKGRALLDGMKAALKAGVDIVVYLNLNLKVHARLTAVGLEMIALNQADIAVGSRAHRDGGQVVGAGVLGRTKSRVFSRIARTALPPLASYVDTNAPIKAFSAQAAAHLIRHARLDDVTLDCEWLLLGHTAGFRMGRFPIAWVQRTGSRPPWHLIGLTLRDLWRLRRRWKAGDMPDRPDGYTASVAADAENRPPKG